MAVVKIIGKTDRWIPIKEYEAMVELKKNMSEEELRRHSYFMWNNFSYDGYEQWVAEQTKKEQDAVQNKED